MERLTVRGEDNRRCHGKAGCRVDKECCFAGCVNFQKVQNRLAEYEDTGLSPGEVAALVAKFGGKA